MSFAETASNVMRTLEYLVEKHCSGIDRPAAPKVSRKILQAIPRVAPRKRGRPPVILTEEQHDQIYAFGTTERISNAGLAQRFNISKTAASRIVTRQHPRYCRKRSEAVRAARL
jgi:hypothetical protein